MNGISTPTQENIGKIVDDLFDNMAIQIIGEVPRLKNKKLAIVSMDSHFGLAHLFVQAMQNKNPNLLEQDVLTGLLKIADGYVDSLKTKTRSNILNSIDAAAREAKIFKRKLSTRKVKEILDEEMKKARHDMNTIVEAEATKFRNFGTMMTITRMAASVGDADPTVYFHVLKDSLTCEECKRVHLMPDGITPRLWKFSQLKQGFHKRGEDFPSILNLHPYCRCSLQYLTRGFTFKNGKLTYDSQNYDAYENQK